MIKVCHMTSAHGRYDVRIFQKECVSLVKAGYKVYLIVSDEKGDEVKDGVHILSTSYRAKNRIDRMVNAVSKVYRKAISVEADIYHFHDPELMLVAKKLEKKGRKVIFDSHENLFVYMGEKEYIPVLFRKLIGKIFTVFLNNACKTFDAVISVDPEICRRYKRVNENVVLVANFPVLQEAEHKKSKEYNTIAFAGGVTDQWNHIAVIKSFEMLEQKVEYVICGAVQEEYLEKMEALPRWEWVKCKGVQKHEDVMNLLACSGIGVALCSYSSNTNQKRGTLGNTKLFEIMMAGVPVICTRFKLWEKIIKKYDCGICVDDPKNSKEIAEAIEYLLDHPQEAKAMGERGRRAVKERFHWSREEKKLLQLYDSL